MKLINFPTVDKEEKLEPDSDVIEKMQHILEIALSGELRQVAIVGMLSTREVITAYGGEVDYFRLLGAIEHLKNRFLMESNDY